MIFAAGADDRTRNCAGAFFFSELGNDGGEVALGGACNDIGSGRSAA